MSLGNLSVTSQIQELTKQQIPQDRNSGQQMDVFVLHRKESLATITYHFDEPLLFSSLCVLTSGNYHHHHRHSLADCHATRDKE